jgi:hypothetical protein
LSLNWIKWYVFDNVLNNDIIVEFLKSKKSDLKWICCSDHIFELSANNVYIELSNKSKHHLIIKFHYICKFVLNNSVQKVTFKVMKKFISMIKVLNETWWNLMNNMIFSCFYNIEVINKFVKESVENHFNKEIWEKLKNSHLTIKNWDFLHELHIILNSFRILTTKL